MARDRRGRRPVHAARLLLQDVHPAAAAVAAVREGPPPRGRPRPAARRRRPSGRGAPSTAAATPTCSSSAAAIAGLTRRDRRGRARRRRGARRRRARAGRAAAVGGRPRARRARSRRERARPASRSWLAPRRSGTSTGSCRSGRATRSTRSARASTSTRPARSSSRSCSPATTCPGVMLSSGARRLAALYGVAPGARAVIATTSDRGLAGRARAPRRRASTIVAVADLRPERVAAAARLSAHGIEVLPGWTVVDGARPTRLSRRGARSLAAARRRRRRSGASSHCDLRARLRRRRARDLAVTQAGARDELRRGARALRARRAARRRVGGGRGRRRGRRRAVAASSGELAGLRGRRTRSGSATSDIARLQRDARAALVDAGVPDADVAVPPPARAARHAASAFACLCEDVTRKDIHRSVEEGYDSIELCKRYTTVTMGPCQGRMCQLAVDPADGARDRAGASSRSGPRRRGRRGRRCRWAALAGRPFEPAKRSSIHGRHRELGAQRSSGPATGGGAYDYGDPEGEALRGRTEPPG